MDLCRLSTSNDGQVTCGAIVFRQDGRAALVAIAKATFRLADGRAAEPIAPEALVVKDRHLGEDGAKSLLAASDVVPFKPRCDVTLVGHACAPRGQVVPSRAVRLLVARLGAAAPGGAAAWRTLADKTIVVFGEPSASGPVPFARARLCYEAARGGAAIEENPVGKEAATQVDPLDEARPVGMGPIPPFWPVRKKRRGAFDGAVLKAAAPDLPAGFPWDFFQTAAGDQQIAHLSGDEVIQLDGLFVDRFRLTTRLPSVRAAAVLYRLGEGGRLADLPLSLVADTLAIDADRGVVSVVWRGRASLSGVDDLPRLHLAAGLSLAGSPIAWPSAAAVTAQIAAAERAPVSAPSPSRLTGHTVALPDELPERAPESVTPFVARVAVERAPESVTPFVARAPVERAPESVTPFVARVAVERAPESAGEIAGSKWSQPRPQVKTIGEMMAMQAPSAPVVAPVVAAPPAAAREAEWIDVDEDTPSEDEARAALAKVPDEAVAKVLREAGASDALVARVLAARGI